MQIIVTNMGEKQKLSIPVLDMFKTIVSVPLPTLKGNCNIMRAHLVTVRWTIKDWMQRRR